MKRIGCPKGFEFNKNLKQCTPIYKYFPDWIRFQKIQKYLENKGINYIFDEYGLKSKNSHLDIYGDDETMQQTEMGWDVDYSQDPECPIDSALDFFAGLYKNPKWQKEFSKMFSTGPHMFSTEERYKIQDMVKIK